MRSELRVELLPGGPKFGPDGLPEALGDARRAGWITLEKLLPGQSERKLFSVWRTCEVVPPHIKWGQWWDPHEKHTVVLWPPALGGFLRDAFLLKPYATLKGRQPRVEGEYGIARMFAPLRLALWAYRTWYDYPHDLIRSSIQYVVEIAERSSPTRFARGPHHLAFAFTRPRSGKNIARARQSLVSLMLPNIEDYYPRDPNEPVDAPRSIDMKFLRGLDKKIRNLDQRRKIIIERLRTQSFERARRAVQEADKNTLERARDWAHYVMVSMFMPWLEPEGKRRTKKRKTGRGKDDPWMRLFSKTMDAQSDYLEKTQAILQDPLTFQELCRNLGLYIGLRIVTYREARRD